MKDIFGIKHRQIILLSSFGTFAVLVFARFYIFKLRWLADAYVFPCLKYFKAVDFSLLLGIKCLGIKKKKTLRGIF